MQLEHPGEQHFPTSSVNPLLQAEQTEELEQAEHSTGQAEHDPLLTQNPVEHVVQAVGDEHIRQFIEQHLEF